MIRRVNFTAESKPLFVGLIAQIFGLYKCTLQPGASESNECFRNYVGFYSAFCMSVFEQNKFVV